MTTAVTHPAAHSATPFVESSHVDNHSQMVATLLEEVGGAESAGRSMGKAFSRVSKKVTEGELTDVKWGKLYVDFAKMVERSIAHADERSRSANPLDDLSPEDVMALCAEASLSTIANSPHFAIRLLKMVRDQQPEIFTELLATGEVPLPEPELIGIEDHPGNEEATESPEWIDELFDEDGSTAA